jgi:hypothetical protein
VPLKRRISNITYVIVRGYSLSKIPSPGPLFYSSPSIIRIIKKRRMRWEGHAAGMGEKRNAYRLML